MESVVYAIASAVIGLGILIVIHEFGHFIVAKKMGVGVVTFSVGFGPKLWKKRIGETEYAVSAFPLGGYVKMVGEEPGEEVQTADIERSFSSQTLARRAAIVAAGPIFNLLLAVLVFTVLFMFFGVPTMRTRVDNVTADMPAAQAGVQKGDRIVAVDGQPITHWEELALRIKGSQGRPLKLRIERDQQQLEVTVQPVKGEGKNIFGEDQDVWLIGIIGSELSIERLNPLQAIGRAFFKTGELSWLTLVALFKMVMGDVSPKNLGGPLMIAQMAGQQAQEGLRSFFSFLALLSINLGVLNLLPIPVLDGGHLFFFLVERVLGRPLEVKHRERAQQVGVFILILVMIYAFYNDLSRFFEG